VNVPCPNAVAVNQTTECAGKCTQGNGTQEETEAYASCQASCISASFFPISTGTAISGSNTASGADATTTGESATGIGESARDAHIVTEANLAQVRRPQAAAANQQVRPAVAALQVQVLRARAVLPMSRLH
jgi:hypothetical protein